MKGQAYFNWIFIIIIGAIALAFFAGFAFQYKELQEKKTEVVFLNSLDTSFTNLQSSTFSTSTKLKIPLDFSIECGDSGFSIVVNEKNSVDYLISSKDNIRKNLYIWYLPYENPFFVTNIYYFIDDDGVYIQTNTPLISQLIEEMPDNFKSRIKVNEGIGRRIDISGNELVIDGLAYSYLGDGLAYAGILSSNYTCFLNHFKSELNDAVLTYESKAEILKRSGCNYNFVLAEMSKLNALDRNAAERIESLNIDMINRGCPSLY